MLPILNAFLSMSNLSFTHFCTTVFETLFELFSLITWTNKRGKRQKENEEEKNRMGKRQKKMRTREKEGGKRQKIEREKIKGDRERIL